MMSTRADRQLCAIRLAQDCAQLGARVRTIHHLTGLNPRDVQRLFFNDPQAIPRGRPPNSLEWYHGANLIARAESSIFMSMYRRLRNTGFGAAETLVSAYRGYQAVCQCPHRISFDRAFDGIAHRWHLVDQHPGVRGPRLPDLRQRCADGHRHRGPLGRQLSVLQTGTALQL